MQLQTFSIQLGDSAYLQSIFDGLDIVEIAQMIVFAREVGVVRVHLLDVVVHLFDDAVELL